MRFHLTSVRMVKVKNSGDSRCWRGCGERGTLLHCWWDCKMVHPLWKSVWRFLRKLDMTLPEDPAIPLLGIYPKDSPACNKDIMGHVSLLHARESSGYMPRRAIAGSSRSVMSSFLRNLQNDFQSGCTILQSHQQWRSVPLSPEFLTLAILTGVR